MPMKRFAWYLGQIVHGSVIGAALVLAIMALLSASGGLAPFRYQGF